MLLFWLSLFVLGVFSLRTRAQRALLMTAAAAWTALVILPAHFEQARLAAERAAAVRAANLALRVGIRHLQSYRPLDCLRDACEQTHTRFLRVHRLGAFASGVHDLLGLHLHVDLDVAPTACPGEIADVELLGDRSRRARGLRGARLVGRVGETSVAPATILVTDASGAVIGLGAGGEPGDAAWLAYVRAPATRGGIEIWGLVGAREVCHVAGPVAPWPGRR